MTICNARHTDWKFIMCCLCVLTLRTRQAPLSQIWACLSEPPCPKTGWSTNPLTGKENRKQQSALKTRHPWEQLGGKPLTSSWGYCCLSHDLNVSIMEREVGSLSVQKPLCCSDISQSGTRADWFNRPPLVVPAGCSKCLIWWCFSIICY